MQRLGWRLLVAALCLICGFLASPRDSNAQPIDAWGALWAHPALAAVELASLDRDPERVKAAASAPEVTSAPLGVQARIGWLEAQALEALGEPAAAASRMQVTREQLEGEGALELAIHARYHEARLRLEGSGGGPAALSLLEGVARHRGLLPGFEVLMARALLGAGRPGEAQALLRELRPRRGEDLWPVRDELLYLEGLAAWRSGAEAEGRRVFRELVMRFPSSRWVGLALGLASLELSSPERLELAGAFLEARDYRGAIETLRPLAEAEGEGGLQQEARYKLGYVEYRLRRADRDAGIALLEQVASKPGARRADAWVLLARASMRHDDYTDALRRWRQFRVRFPKDPRAHEATYYHGWLPMDQGRYAEGAAGFEAYLEAWPTSSRADDARWFLGWSRWRSGRAEAAVEAWDAALREHRGDPLGAEQVLYWRAQALSGSGQGKRGRQDAERLLRDHAWTYYGRLQAIREGEEGALFPGAAAGEGLEPAAAWAAMDSLPPRTRDAARVVRDLIHLGRYEEARRRATPALRASVVADARGGLEGERAEELGFFLAEEVGDVEGAFREAARQGAAFRSPPTLATRGVWRRAYPRPFRRLVEHEAARRQIHPWLLWSIMQKESAYDPLALSYADAMGLMQIIPKTGARIAEAQGEVYREGMLFDPHVNIAYAAWYLSELQRKFHGQVALSAAAYNGGPLAVDRWLRDRPGQPFDVWVEGIAYDQARTYARKVLTILGRYIMVYGPRTGRGDPLVDGLYPPDLKIRGDSLPTIDF